MLFNSLDFLIFFPVIVGLYFALSPKYRWVLLLGASYYFYMCWKAEYIILIVFSTLVDYFAAGQMARIQEKKKRRPFLYLSLLSNLGLLFFFKYWNFFSGETRALLDSWNIMVDVPTFQLLLPVGISFYTFQTLSYTIDVYNGKLEPEKNLGRFALYVSFFPQLVAGPIERATHLLPQLRKTFDFDYQRVVSGLQQMLWGFFKKVVIADRLAVYVNEIYASPGDENGLALLLATYFFAFQIYCDFSGYSDIAIGAARVMGYDLMENFRTPYLSRSIREFWSRWHISLSTWFRDYLYIPLGGNRVPQVRWFLNLFIVFVVSGFWHGANWTFLIWGALHGSYLVAEILWKRLPFAQFKGIPTRLKNILSIGITFHLTLLAWVFFRANSLGDAITVIRSVVELPLTLSVEMIRETINQAGGLTWLVTAFILVLFVFADPVMDKAIKKLRSGKSISYAFGIFASILSGIIILGYFGEVEFIYFQF
ncbi:MAG: MBOAT family O-acyltransferase [Bacteroidota bacterium]